MPQHTVLIIHETREKAQRLMTELGVKGEPAGWGAASRGRRYERIYILKWPTVDILQEWIGSLHTQLKPNGVLINLS